MKFKLFLFFVCLGVLIELSTTNSHVFSAFQTSTVEAYGDLLVDFYVPVDTPMFTLTQIKPGETYSHLLAIKNLSNKTETVFIKGIQTGGTNLQPAIESMLELVIKEGNHIRYGTGSSTGRKTLAQFFKESTKQGVAMDQLSSRQQKQYQLIVSFPASAGNEFQGKSVSFTASFIGSMTQDHDKQEHDDQKEKRH